MTDAPELKPCPFCGGSARYVRDHTVEKIDQLYCTDCFACIADRDEEGDCAEIWNTRPAPKVKPLVWDDFDGGGAKARGFYHASYIITYWRGRCEFEVSMSYPGYQTGYDGKRFHQTIEDAKAAAEADYERQILDALL